MEAGVRNGLVAFWIDLREVVDVDAAGLSHDRQSLDIDMTTSVHGPI